MYYLGPEFLYNNTIFPNFFTFFVLEINLEF